MLDFNTLQCTIKYLLDTQLNDIIILLITSLIYSLQL